VPGIAGLLKVPDRVVTANAGSFLAIFVRPFDGGNDLLIALAAGRFCDFAVVRLYAKRLRESARPRERH
jgi:hypothetical protein